MRDTRRLRWRGGLPRAVARRWEYGARSRGHADVTTLWDAVIDSMMAA